MPTSVINAPAQGLAVTFDGAERKRRSPAAGKTHNRTYRRSGRCEYRGHDADPVVKNIGMARKEKAEPAEKICTALEVHTTIEEEIVCPAARKAGRDEDLRDEALVERAGARDRATRTPHPETG